MQRELKGAEDQVRTDFVISLELNVHLTLPLGRCIFTFIGVQFLFRPTYAPIVQTYENKIIALNSLTPTHQPPSPQMEIGKPCRVSVLSDDSGIMLHVPLSTHVYSLSFV